MLAVYAGLYLSYSGSAEASYRAKAVQKKNQYWMLLSH